jgi:hypothetical protein
LRRLLQVDRDDLPPEQRLLPGNDANIVRILIAAA